MRSMTEQQTETTTALLDSLERVTIASDGGVGSRGWTSVVYLNPAQVEWFKAELEARRAL